MSNKVKALFFICIIVVSLSATTIFYMLMPPCELCGDKLCNGDCTIIYEDLEDGVSGGKLKATHFDTNQRGTRLAETTPADDDYINGITYIGDSRTVAYVLNTGIPEERIFAEQGLNHEDALTMPVVKVQEYKSVSIPEAVKLTAPDIMLLNFGINGVAWMDVATFIEGYEKLLDELITSSPSSIIIIESILPVSSFYEGISNSKIDEVNDALYELAQQKGLYYLAADEALKDDTNSLADGFSGDGLHYNKAAYDVLIEYIRTHAIYRTNQ